MFNLGLAFGSETVKPLWGGTILKQLPCKELGKLSCCKDPPREEGAPTTCAGVGLEDQVKEILKTRGKKGNKEKMLITQEHNHPILVGIYFLK